MQRRMGFSRAETQHRRFRGPSKNAEILGCAHWQSVTAMRDIQLGKRRQGHGRRLGVINRSGKIIMRLECGRQPVRCAQGADQFARGAIDLGDGIILAGAQRCKNFRMARGDTEGWLSGADMGDGDKPEAVIKLAPRTAVRAAFRAKRPQPLGNRADKWHRRDGKLRLGGVACPARQGDRKPARGAVHQPRARCDMAERQPRFIMDCESPVWCDGFISRVGNHCAGAAAVFLSRLEHQHHTSALHWPPRQQPAKPQQHGHMAVMPAQMALSLGLRLPVCAGCLRYREGVELSPEQHGGAGLGTSEDAGDTMAAKAGQHSLGMKPVKRIGNLGGRPFFLARQFGPSVKVTAEGHKFSDVGICQHGLPAVGAGSACLPQAGSR